MTTDAKDDVERVVCSVSGVGAGSAPYALIGGMTGSTSAALGGAGPVGGARARIAAAVSDWDRDGERRCGAGKAKGGASGWKSRTGEAALALTLALGAPFVTGA